MIIMLFSFVAFRQLFLLANQLLGGSFVGVALGLPHGVGDMQHAAGAVLPAQPPVPGAACRRPGNCGGITFSGAFCFTRGISVYNKMFIFLHAKPPERTESRRACRPFGRLSREVLVACMGFTQGGWKCAACLLLP